LFDLFLTYKVSAVAKLVIYLLEELGSNVAFPTGAFVGYCSLKVGLV